MEVIPFTQEFGDQLGNRDRSRAKRIIETELSGILNWAIGGYRSLQEAGSFIEPECSREALNDYRCQIDPTLEFVQENTRLLPDDTPGTPLKDIYERYKEWIDSNRGQSLGRNAFYRQLELHTKRKVIKPKGQGRYIPGLMLL